MMKLLVTVCSGILLLAVTTFAQEENDYSKNIVGMWEITKAGTGAPVGSTLEFSKDGKVVATIKGSNLTLKGTFAIKKDTLTMNLDSVGEESMKIAKLTKDTLVTKAGERETVHKKMARPADKTDPKKSEPLTIDGVIGSKWKGEYDGGTVEATFRSTRDKKFLSVLLVIKTGGSETIGNVPWELDAKKNEIKFGDVTAKPTKDGSLVLNGNAMLGLTTFAFKEVRVERAKEAKEPKK